MNIRTTMGKLGLILLGPLAVLGAAEGMLRMLDLGLPTEFLRQADSAGERCWVNNPFYGYRFFAPRMARNPAPIQIAQAKVPGRTRLAVLGESAAMGDPAIEFSLARGLEKMLNAPGHPQQFEVINAAMTAINSPVVVDIADNLAHSGVDGFIIYMGNNEVVGPYGPGTAITSGHSNPRWTAWRVALTRLRLTGFLRPLAQLIQGTGNSEAWGGMEMFEANRLAEQDLRLPPMYRQFEANLNRILALAEQYDMHVLLCTVAVNLSDNAPFGSAHRSDLTSAQVQFWNRQFHDGRMAYQEGRLEAAESAYQQARELDDQHAELIYRLGQVQLELDHPSEARRLFARARDLDTLRFRADTEINRIIRAVAAQNPKVVLADIESAFAEQEDRDLFVDHVHFSLNGLYQVCQILHATLGPPYPERPAPLSAQAFFERLMVTPWSERTQATIMQQRRERPPFNTQWRNGEHLTQLKQRIDLLSARIATTEVASVKTAFALRQEAEPDDLFYAQQLGHILSIENRWEEAAPVLQEAAGRLSGYTDIHSLAALALARTGQPGPAADLLRRTGPPYGYYLADAAGQTITTLKQMGEREAAQAFTRALLDQTPRFPDRERVVRAAHAPTHPPGNAYE